MLEAAQLHEEELKKCMIRTWYQEDAKVRGINIPSWKELCAGISAAT